MNIRIKTATNDRGERFLHILTDGVDVIYGYFPKSGNWNGLVEQRSTGYVSGWLEPTDVPRLVAATLRGLTP